MARIEELEVLVRALGLPYTRREGSLIVSVEDAKHGTLNVVVMYDEESDTVRLASPLDVEPYREALQWFLSENFTSTTYKYALDYDGFVAVVYDLPSKCVRTAKDLREAILEVVEGAKRVLERVEEAPQAERPGEGEEKDYLE